MGIRPWHNLLERVSGKILAISLAAMIVEQPGERLATPKAAITQAQRGVDIGPLFVDRLPNQMSLLPSGQRPFCS